MNMLKQRIPGEHVTDLATFWKLRKLHDKYQMKKQLKKKKKGSPKKSKLGLSSEMDESQDGISYLAEYMGSKLPPKKSRKVANSTYQDNFDKEFGKFSNKDKKRGGNNTTIPKGASRSLQQGKCHSTVEVFMETS